MLRGLSISHHGQHKTAQFDIVKTVVVLDISWHWGIWTGFFTPASFFA